VRGTPKFIVDAFAKKKSSLTGIRRSSSGRVISVRETPIGPLVRAGSLSGRALGRTQHVGPWSIRFFLCVKILENIIHVVKNRYQKDIAKHNIFVYLKHLEK
jgi:hypothetical protein